MGNPIYQEPATYTVASEFKTAVNAMFVSDDGRIEVILEYLIEYALEHRLAYINDFINNTNIYTDDNIKIIINKPTTDHPRLLKSINFNEQLFEFKFERCDGRWKPSNLSIFKDSFEYVRTSIYYEFPAEFKRKFRLSL